MFEDMIPLAITACRAAIACCAICALHNPRGHHSHQRAQIYTFIMTISRQKAVKCLVLTKSVYHDNFPTFATRGSQKMVPFFPLMYTKEKHKLAAVGTAWKSGAGRWPLPGELPEAEL